MSREMKAPCYLDPRTLQGVFAVEKRESVTVSQIVCGGGCGEATPLPSEDQLARAVELSRRFTVPFGADAGDYWPEGWIRVQAEDGTTNYLCPTCVKRHLLCLAEGKIVLPDALVKEMSRVVDTIEVGIAWDLQALGKGERNGLWQKAELHVFPGPTNYVAVKMDEVPTQLPDGTPLALSTWIFCDVTPDKLRALADTMERRQVTLEPKP